MSTSGSHFCVLNHSLFFVCPCTVLGYATEEIAMRLGDVSATHFYCVIFSFQANKYDMTWHGMEETDDSIRKSQRRNNPFFFACDFLLPKTIDKGEDHMT